MKRFVVICLLGLAAALWLEPKLKTSGDSAEISVVSDVLGSWHESREGGFYAKVVGISDGDTLTVLTQQDRQMIKVRLEGIDAPEMNQPFGGEAKKLLGDLVFNKEVVVVPKEKDQYERTVGRIYFGEMDVNKEMVSRGLAWHFMRYNKEVSMISAQISAKSKRTGLWARAGAVEPWEWRKRGR